MSQSWRWAQWPSALGKTWIISPDLGERTHHSSCQVTVIRHVHNGEHFINWRLLNCRTCQRKPVVTDFWAATKWFSSSNTFILVQFPLFTFHWVICSWKVKYNRRVSTWLLRLSYYIQGTFALLGFLNSSYGLNLHVMLWGESGNNINHWTPLQMLKSQASLGKAATPQAQLGPWVRDNYLTTNPGFQLSSFGRDSKYLCLQLVSIGVFSYL